jgi:hypothetical protein
LLLGLLIVALGCPDTAFSAPLKNVRAYNSSGELYGSMTRSCLSALKEIVEGYGISFETVDDLKQPKPDTVDLLVRPNFTNMNFMGRPPVLYLMDETAVFAGPAHFAKVIESNYYQGLMSGASQFIVDTKLVGQAYGSSAQIFTEDGPILTPADLRGRTMIGAFGSSWYTTISKELGIGFDEVLDHTEFKITDQRSALRNAAGEHRKDGYFVVMPILLASELLPMPLSRHVSLTMSHTSLVDFEVTNWFALDQDSQTAIEQIVAQAVSQCSAENYDAEKKALQSMVAGGSTVTPVKLEPFIKLAEQSLRKQVTEASSDQSKLESAKEKLAFFQAIQRIR